MNLHAYLICSVVSSINIKIVTAAWREIWQSTKPHGMDGHQTGYGQTKAHAESVASECMNVRQALLQDTEAAMAQLLKHTYGVQVHPPPRQRLGCPS
eukprot:2858043-Amphidinium_carterae.1